MKNALIKFWNPQPEVYSLAIFRILWATLTAFDFSMYAGELKTWYMNSGITLDSQMGTSLPFQFRLLSIFPDSFAWVLFLYGALLLSLFFVVLGYRTKFFLVVSYLLILAFHVRQPYILNSGHDLMRTFGFFMIFAPIHQVWSLDARAGRVKPVSMSWAYRMLQVQLSLMYMSTFLFKIQGDLWVNGTAVYVTSRLIDFWRYDIPFIFDTWWILKFMTWGALTIEFAMGFLIWIRPLRMYVLLGALLLHAMIEYTMTIPTFEFMSLIGLLLFVPDLQLKKVLLAFIKKP